MLLTACGANSAKPVAQPINSPMPTRSISTIDPALVVSPAPIESPVQGSEQTPAVVAARASLAKKLGIEATEVTLVSVEEVQWPDGCLGVKRPGVMCTQVIVDGFRIMLEANGTRYEVHTDATGRQAVLASLNP